VRHEWLEIFGTGYDGWVRKAANDICSSAHEVGAALPGSLAEAQALLLSEAALGSGGGPAHRLPAPFAGDPSQRDGIAVVEAAFTGSPRSSWPRPSSGSDGPQRPAADTLGSTGFASSKKKVLVRKDPESPAPPPDAPE
jgi:hypothetical protein